MVVNFKPQFKSNNNGQVYAAMPLMKDGNWDVEGVGVLSHPVFLEAFAPEGGRESKLLTEMDASIAAPKIPALPPGLDVEKSALAPEVAAKLKEEVEAFPPLPEVETPAETELGTETITGVATSEYGLSNDATDLQAIRASAAEERAVHDAELAKVEEVESLPEHESAFEPEADDGEISAAEAIEVVKIETDMKALELWLDSDSRKSVKRAVRKRMKQLQE